MFITKIRKNKFEVVVICIAFLISIIWSLYNIKNFDNNKINFKGNWYNQLIYADIGHKWRKADDFRKKLNDGESFFEALPIYEKYFLPNIIVGYYYYIIDKEIYEKKPNGQRVIKVDNNKIGLLLAQIIFFYISVIFFASQLKKKVDPLLYKLIIFFLCLEPSIIQWHSTFWTESIFLSLMVILFSLLIKKKDKFIINLFIGIIVGLMFAQRSVSFLYILPILILYFLNFKLNIKPYLFLIIGYSLIVLPIGYNNFKKTGNFHFLSKDHQYYSFYHYFAHVIKADRQKISKQEAKEILLKEEKNWIKNNKIDIKIFDDYVKNIDYRNKIFLKELFENPIFFLKLYTKKIITMSIINPLWTHEHYYYDKSDPESYLNPKKYYHKNLYKSIIYSLFLYPFVILGVFFFIKKIFIRERITEFDFFLIFNIFSILYYLFISGLWGNPKYFAPCMISTIFFFSIGLKKIIIFFQKNKEIKG